MIYHTAADYRILKLDGSDPTCGIWHDPLASIADVASYSPAYMMYQEFDATFVIRVVLAMDAKHFKSWPTPAEALPTRRQEAVGCRRITGVSASAPFELVQRHILV